MSQEFNGPVMGDIAGRDVVNQIHHDASRVLTSQERKELNDRVKQLEDGYGEPGWKTWRFLHRTIGIESIEAMRLDHRDSAHAIVDLMIERAMLQKNCNTQQNHDEDSAGQLAALLMQNSKLTAQLKESQSVRALLERRLRGEIETRSQLEKYKVEADKNERLIAHASGQCRQLEKYVVHAKKRGNRRLVLVGVFAVTTLAGAASTYWQMMKAEAARIRPTLCAFNGQAYAIGSVVDGTPDKECVLTADRGALWQTKARRSK